MVRRDKLSKKPFEGFTFKANSEKRENLRRRILDLDEKVGRLKRKKKRS